MLKSCMAAVMFVTLLAWTATAQDSGKQYNVVFVCSASALDYPLVENPQYPRISAAARRTRARPRA